MAGLLQNTFGTGKKTHNKSQHLILLFYCNSLLQIRLLCRLRFYLFI